MKTLAQQKNKNQKDKTPGVSFLGSLVGSVTVDYRWPLRGRKRYTKGALWRGSRWAGLVLDLRIALEEPKST